MDRKQNDVEPARCSEEQPGSEQHRVYLAADRGGQKWFGRLVRALALFAARAFRCSFKAAEPVQACM